MYSGQNPQGMNPMAVPVSGGQQGNTGSVYRANQGMNGGQMMPTNGVQPNANPVQGGAYNTGQQVYGKTFSANDPNNLPPMPSMYNPNSMQSPQGAVNNGAVPASSQNLTELLGSLGIEKKQLSEQQPTDTGLEKPAEQQEGEQKPPETISDKLGNIRNKKSDINETFPSLSKRTPPRSSKESNGKDGDNGKNGGNGNGGNGGNGGSRKNGSPNGKKKKKKKNGKKTKLRIAMEILLGLVCFCVIAGCGVLVAVSYYLADVTADDDVLLDLNTVKLSFSTILMAYDEEVGDYTEYQRIYADENRRWIELADMPEHLLEVTMASEDHGFYEHHGVDWIRTVAAFVNAYTPIQVWDTVQGGSTLTQQLVKNITTENNVSGIEGALRKIREIFRALVMEQNFSKDQILESYLNTISLSGTVAGIEAAANHYFNKSTEELTIAECAAIVVITKQPTANSPFGYPENNKDARDFVLWQMYNDYGMLTQAEYNAAQAESDAMVFPETGYTNSGEDIYSFFTDTAIDEVIRDLQAFKGMTEDEAYDYLHTGGLTVYLTIDKEIQEVVDNAVIDEDGFILWEGHNPDDATEPVEGAIVVMDFEGQLKGIAGSILPKEQSRTFNYATEALKQPGSTMKPIAPYVEAVDTDKIHYSTVFVDAPISNLETNSTEDPNWPSNWGGVWSMQLVTVVKAIEVSLNTTAAAAMGLVGSSFAFDYLETRLGLTTLDDESFPNSDRNAGGALGLGMLQYGTNLYEMTAAYQVFGNGGQYYKPHSYSRVVDSRGQVILDASQQFQPIQSLSTDTAMVMNKLLESVMIRGTGSRWNNAAFDHPADLPHAGKSGTADDGNGNATDLWFIGMDPYYVTGVWVGHKTKVPIDEKTDNGYSANRSAWRYVMENITQDLPYKDFPVDETVTSHQYCVISGDLATAGCITGDAAGWYKASNVPSVCTSTDHNPELVYGYKAPEA